MVHLMIIKSIYIE